MLYAVQSTGKRSHHFEEILCRCSWKVWLRNLSNIKQEILNVLKRNLNGHPVIILRYTNWVANMNKMFEKEENAAEFSMLHEISLRGV